MPGWLVLAKSNVIGKKCMNGLTEIARRSRHLFDRLVVWLWSLVHPCRIGWNEYDHDWKYIDDSFSHEFGTEVCGHWECEFCDAEDFDREPPGYDDYYDPAEWH